MSTTRADFTAEELAEFRVLIKYAEEVCSIHSREVFPSCSPPQGYNRQSIIDRMSMIDPYLHPIKHNERLSACLDVDRDSEDGTDETDTTGLNNPTRVRETATTPNGTNTDHAFAFRRGRLRKFIRALVELINKRASPRR